MSTQSPTSPTTSSPGANGSGRGQARSVLVVDDEPTIAEVVSRYLQRAGYETQVAHDGAQALASSAQRRPDLVVLDVMLPGTDGLRLMSRLRDQDGRPLGVILLTARGEQADRIAGLRLGADDYVVKPFSPAELVARVDAVLRRVDPPVGDAGLLVLGPIRIEPASRRVFARGEEVVLTAREFDLLLHMARHPHQVFSRDQLMEAVWQYAFFTDTSTVTVHIRRLRAKLEADPARPRHLETVWGVGYRFAA
jgi:DNA-binding response OmpR family regulator